MLVGVDPDMAADDSLTALLASHQRGVLTTIKGDGRPQLSNVAYWWDDGTVRISVTDGRAKTANLRRDPRISLHVTTDDFWQYVVAEGDAELSPVASDPGDATCDLLVAYYRAVAGEHDDWDEYRAAMVSDRRLLISFAPAHLYGQAG